MIFISKIHSVKSSSTSLQEELSVNNRRVQMAVQFLHPEKTCDMWSWEAHIGKLISKQKNRPQAYSLNNNIHQQLLDSPVQQKKKQKCQSSQQHLVQPLLLVFILMITLPPPLLYCTVSVTHRPVSVETRIQLSVSMLPSTSLLPLLLIPLLLLLLLGCVFLFLYSFLLVSIFCMREYLNFSNVTCLVCRI